MKRKEDDVGATLFSESLLGSAILHFTQERERDQEENDESDVS